MMINKITKSLIMFLGVIFLISCAAQDDILYLNNQLKTIQVQIKTDSQKTEKMREDLGSGLESIGNKMSELEP